MKARGCFTRNFSSSSSYLGTASSSARTHLNAFRTSSYAATLVTPLISATGKSSLRSTKAFLAVGTTSAPVRGFESVPVASTPSMGRPLVMSGITQFGPLLVELLEEDEDETLSARATGSDLSGYG